MRLLLAIGLGLGILIGLHVPARPHDAHHPEHNDWYMSLMRPDNPSMSCCGLADAYWADEVKVVNGEAYVKIQDERDDEMLGRPHIPSGTWVHVPSQKLKHDKGNPTGHGVIFIGHGDLSNVYCYVQGTGI